MVEFDTGIRTEYSVDGAMEVVLVQALKKANTGKARSMVWTMPYVCTSKA